MRRVRREVVVSRLMYYICLPSRFKAMIMDMNVINGYQGCLVVMARCELIKGGLFPRRKKTEDSSEV